MKGCFGWSLFFSIIIRKELVLIFSIRSVSEVGYCYFLVYGWGSGVCYRMSFVFVGFLNTFSFLLFVWFIRWNRIGFVFFRGRRC